MIECKSPINSEIIATINSTKPDDLEAIYKDSADAFRIWSHLSLKERLKYMQALRKYLVEMGDELSREISKATGKPVIEAYTSEILAVIEAIKYYEKTAEDILSTKKVSSPLYFKPKKSYVEYRPLGTVLVISPWNFPFSLSMVPTISALIAGNSVILKPSFETLAVGKLIERMFTALNFPKKIVQVVYANSNSGLGEKLIDLKPNKIFFTGSTATGKKILKQASEHLIPVELELGGKDPMIVFKDANLERASSAAVWGAFTNSGQVCLSVERAYVQEEIYDEFLSLVKAKIGELWQGTEPYADLGCMTSDNQVSIVKSHIEDAKLKGAELYTKAEMIDNNKFISPVLLSGVNHDMLVMREETFGPVLPVMKFRYEDEAVELANDSIYGLGASIFTSDANKASRVSSKLNAGVIAINEVIVPVANMALPFGGVKASGMGRYHGKEGLLSFVNEVGIVEDTGIKNKEIQWFPYSKNKMNLFKKMVKMLYS